MTIAVTAVSGQLGREIAPALLEVSGSTPISTHFTENTQTLIDQCRANTGEL